MLLLLADLVRVATGPWADFPSSSSCCSSACTTSHVCCMSAAAQVGAPPRPMAVLNKEPFGELANSQRCTYAEAIGFLVLEGSLCLLLFGIAWTRCLTACSAAPPAPLLPPDRPDIANVVAARYSSGKAATKQQLADIEHRRSDTVISTLSRSISRDFLPARRQASLQWVTRRAGTCSQTDFANDEAGEDEQKQAVSGTDCGQQVQVPRHILGTGMALRHGILCSTPLLGTPLLGFITAVLFQRTCH